jgi:hypothetical protein
MLFTSDMPTYTQKNGALRAHYLLGNEPIFRLLAWLISQPLLPTSGPGPPARPRPRPRPPPEPEPRNPHMPQQHNIYMTCYCQYYCIADHSTGSHSLHITYGQYIIYYCPESERGASPRPACAHRHYQCHWRGRCALCGTRHGARYHTASRSTQRTAHSAWQTTTRHATSSLRGCGGGAPRVRALCGPCLSHGINEGFA